MVIIFIVIIMESVIHCGVVFSASSFFPYYSSWRVALVIVLNVVCSFWNWYFAACLLFVLRLFT